MDAPSPADEGDTGSIKTSFRKIFIVAAAFLLFASCNQRKEKIPVAVPVATDSTVIKKQPPAVADSVSKAAVPKKKIYLTFDDGPNRGTRNVLQAIKEEDIPVSFFIVGKHVFDSPEQTATWELLKEDTAVELCNHSYTHAANRYAKFYESPETVVEDFQQNQEKLQFTNNVIRMPGRNAWRIDSISVTDIKESKRAIDSVHKAGFDVMGWDIEWSFDHKTLVPDSNTTLLLRRIQNLLDAGTTKTPGHLVLLAHDQAFQKEENVEKLHSFLQELKLNPLYEFVKASEYPGVKKDLP
jgi:peptidoglycan-N-acetylglucosamine deacetylase